MCQPDGKECVNRTMGVDGEDVNRSDEGMCQLLGIQMNRRLWDISAR
jgi:hypothetical protein